MTRIRAFAWALGGGAAAACVLASVVCVGIGAHDRAVLQQSADSVGEALALAAHLGFKPLARAH